MYKLLLNFTGLFWKVSAVTLFNIFKVAVNENINYLPSNFDKLFLNYIVIKQYCKDCLI